MSGFRYLPKIIVKYVLKENPFDILKMLNLLAEQRATYAKRQIFQSDYDFAAKVICVILAPLKPPVYKKKMKSMRLHLAGIWNQQSIQADFRNMMLGNVLKAESAEEAIKLGFDNLFDYSYNDESSPNLMPG